MKRALLLACALTLVPGCSYFSPESNQPPTAEITSISPATATEGQTVRFSGHGTDVDGEVVGYRWRSDIDGELSRSSSFATDTLSAGNHAIYFMVQDNSDAWSTQVQGTVTVRATPPIPAVIDSFAAWPTNIRAGESVILSWEVSHATKVEVDQGIGVVPEFGTVEVIPDVTTTYVLTATGSSSTAAASVTIAVEPVRVLVMMPDRELTGYVRFSGYAPSGDVYVGDDQADRGIRGFLTYYISSIPDDAVVTRVIVDLSGYETPYDLPFPDLGCLSAFEHPYNSLQGEYRMPGLPGAIGEWCDFDQLDTPTESIAFRNALQDRVGESKFQFRLQFADMESDGDMTRDFLHWRDDQLPTLTVEYYPNRR